MSEKQPLSEFSLEQYISPDARKIVQQILTSKPGLFLMTGQPGTGKTATLLIIAYAMFEQGHPITVLTEDPDFEGRCTRQLPKDWTIQYVENSNQDWLEAVSAVLAQEPERVIVMPGLTGDNNTAALSAVQAGRWVLTSIDTPFVGIDVLYNLRGWGFTNQEILECVVGILSQVLLPRLCEDCKKLELVTLEKTRLVYPDSDVARELWREQGCPICEHRGVGGRWRYGRCAAFEVLQVDDYARPFLATYLTGAIPPKLPTQQHLTLLSFTRELVKTGVVGIETYHREVVQNPLLRTYHLWEQESLRANKVQEMFSRFVTQHLVERIISQTDFERIIEGENRQVTCVFCDIRGFTALSEQSSPTEIFWLLNHYFQDIIEIVFDYEGTIDKFIGDSIMIIFGAPVDQPDHALRAVQCAIRIQQRVVEINQSQTAQLPINIGIGINSGEVVAGCLGSNRRMDYTVLGDVVNTAARLESRAQPQQILVGKKTHELIQFNIECCSLGFVSLKGKAEPVEVFEVIYSPDSRSSV